MSDEDTVASDVPVEDADSGTAEAEVEEPSVEESATSDETEGDEGKPKKRGGFQRRIDELTRQRYEAEQRAKQLEEQLNETRNAQVKSQHELGKPRLEDFNYDHDAWTQAYEQWVQKGFEEQQQAQVKAKEHAEQQQQAIQRQIDLQTKVAKASEKYPDFHQKVFDPQLPSLQQLNPYAFEAVVDSEYMADVAYYLASNPADVYKFSQLSPIQAVKEIARLEAKFSSKPKTQSNAPPPPSTVSGRAESVKTLETAKDINEWMALRNKQRNGT